LPAQMDAPNFDEGKAEAVTMQGPEATG